MTNTPERMTPEAAQMTVGDAIATLKHSMRRDADVRRVFLALDTLAVLAQRVESQDAEIEQLRVQLAGCGVAAMCNTRESLAQHCAIKPGDYGWSASFGDCVRAAEREIAERERADALEKDAGRLNAMIENEWQVNVYMGGPADRPPSYVVSTDFQPCVATGRTAREAIDAAMFEGANTAEGGNAAEAQRHGGRDGSR